MRKISPPPRPSSNSDEEAIARYNREYQSYRVQVEQVNQDIIDLGRAIYELCDQISFEPHTVMSTVSPMIWQGNAANRFLMEGGTQNRELTSYIETIRQSASSTVSASSSFTSSI